MENCSICNSDYKKAYKSDHLKSIKHLQKLNQYYCKKCNTFMPLSDKSNHLNSDEHKNKTKQQREATQIWCEDCGKYISNSRHFQSEIHTLRSQNNATKNTFGNTLHDSGTNVEIIVNEKTYIKLRISPTNHLDEQINDLLNKNYFPRYKFQLSYLAKFSKYINGEEIVFHKWVKSDFNYNHTQIAFGTNPNIHNILMQKLDDEQLEGSGFVLNGIVNVILEIYKVNDIQASSWVELPEKYKNNKSIINIKNDDQFCFLWCILAHLFPVEDHKNRTSNYSMHTNKLILNGLEFPMKIKDIPKFENLNNLNVNDDPLYSYSLPGYTWKAGLKLTKIKLDYIKCKELLLLLENNIRGGISSVMGPRFIESNENTKLLYIDANNLYGWAMSQYLPTGDFKKMQGYTQNCHGEAMQSDSALMNEITEDILNTPDDNEFGYFIECD